MILLNTQNTSLVDLTDGTKYLANVLIWHVTKQEFCDECWHLNISAGYIQHLRDLVQDTSLFVGIVVYMSV